MKRLPYAFLFGLALCLPHAGIFAAQELLDKSWRELVAHMPEEYSRPAPQIVEAAAIGGRTAEADHNGLIKVSREFLDKLSKYSEAEIIRRGVLLFVLGHEVAHRYLPRRNDPNIETQADFFSAVTLRGMSNSYAAAGEHFFKFAKGSLGESDAHGTAEYRKKHLDDNEKEIERIGALYSKLNEQLDAISSGSVNQVMEAISIFESAIAGSKISDMPNLKLAMAVMRHKFWLADQISNDELKVQFSVYVPLELARFRSKKGSGNIPGDKVRYRNAVDAYNEYIVAMNGGDAYAKIGRLALLVYDKNSKRLTEFEELTKTPPADAQSLNNLGAVGVILAADAQLPAEKAISLLRAAQKANASAPGASDKQLPAKILFNLSRAYEFANQKSEAEKFMAEFRAHPLGDHCWKQPKFACAATSAKFAIPTELGGLKLGTSRKQAEAQTKNQFSTCKPGNFKPDAKYLVFSCPKGAIRLVIIEEKLAFIEMIGLATPKDLLTLTATDGGEKVAVNFGQTSVEIQQKIAMPAAREYPQRAYEKLGLYMLFDSTDKLESLGIGFENRMSWQIHKK